MCNLMASYFKRNWKVQRNERQRRYKRADQSRQEQADYRMGGAIRAEHIRHGATRLEHTELMGIIRLEQSVVKASGEKRDRSERSKNITEREKSRAKREKIKLSLKHIIFKFLYRT